MDCYFFSISTTSLIGLLTFLIGLLVGHRLALGRDKRREFNEIIKPIRERLIAEREFPNPAVNCPLSAADEDVICSILPSRQRASFREACKTYRAERDGNISIGAYGVASYTNPQALINHLNSLLHFIERK